MIPLESRGVDCNIAFSHGIGLAVSYSNQAFDVSLSLSLFSGSEKCDRIVELQSTELRLAIWLSGCLAVNDRCERPPWPFSFSCCSFSCVEGLLNGKGRCYKSAHLLFYFWILDVTLGYSRLQLLPR